MEASSFHFLLGAFSDHCQAFSFQAILQRYLISWIAGLQSTLNSL